MNSYKKLFNNSIIFAVGSLGSKILNILLVPMYTYYLSTAEYGTVDLATTTVTMLLPVVSASMQDAVLRFSMNREYDRSKTFTNAFFILLAGYIIFILIYPVVEFFLPLPNILIYIYIILLLQIVDRFLAQYARGIGKSKVFAIDGFLTTLFLGVFNVLFLSVFHMSVNGYFYAMIVAYALSILYLITQVNVFKLLNIRHLEISFSKTLLKYSLPLIPNSLMWWLVNASSRYFILGYSGIEANGIYAVASKIPSIMNLISTVFSQAWQLSAIEEVEKKKNSNFFSNIFNLLVTVMLTVSSLILVILKPLLSIVVANDFYSAWQASPFLLLGVVFSSISSFLGAFYIATLKTKGVFNTSIFGGISSLVFNFVLIPSFGIIGAGIASMISFFIMAVYRYWDVRKDVNVKLNYLTFVMSLLLITTQIIVLFAGLTSGTEFIINIIVLFSLILVNKNVLMSCVSKAFSLLFNFRK